MTPEETIAKVHNEITSGSQGSCILYNCDPHYTASELHAPEIVINSCYEFQNYKGNQPTRFFFNKALSSNLLYDISQVHDIEAYDICSIMTHKLGHFYGLGHADECIPGIDAVMNSHAKSNSIVDLYDYDKCAFKKLYCPGLTPVEEEMYRPGTERLYPNPATNILNVQFEHLYGFKEVSFEIVDMGGNMVYRFTDNSMPSGNFVKPIDISPFPQGAYLIRIHYDNKTVSKMFEIIR